MVRVNGYSGRNGFWSILLLAISSCTLFSGAAFSEEVTAEAIESLAEAGRVCALAGDAAGAEAALSQLYLQYPGEPQVVPAIERIAQAFFTKNNIAKAQAIYSEAITKIPADNPIAVWLHRRVILCQIAQGNITGADESIAAFKNDFSGNPKRGIVLLNLANDCLALGKFDKSRDLCQYVAQNSSDSSVVFEARTGVVRSEIRSGNDSAVQQAVGAILNDYSDSEKLCDSVFSLVRDYEKLNRLDKTRDLCQYIAESASNSSLELKARTWAACMDIKSGNNIAAEQAIAALKNDYSGSEELYNSISIFAKDYGKLNLHDKAKALYQYIAENTSDSKMATNARSQIVVCDISSGNDAAAREAFDTLWTEYGSEAGFVDQVLGICNVFIKENDPAIALPYIDRALQAGPDSEKVKLLLKLKAECYAAMGEDMQANDVLDEIAQTDSTDEEFAIALNKTADRSREQGDYEKSIELYQEVLDGDANEDQQIIARRGLAKSYVRLGNDPNVTQQLDMIIANHPKHKQLAYTVYVIGEEHYLIGEKLRSERKNAEAQTHFQKAINIWKQRILDSMEGCNHDAEAYLFSGICHSRLGQEEQALEYFRKIIQNWPDFKQIAITFSWYEGVLEDMTKKGLLTSEEAVLLAEEVFGGFIAKYPDHIYFKTALRRLGDFYFSQSRYGNAINYYDTLIGNDITHLKYVHHRYCKALEAVGRDDTAEEVRRVLAEMQQQ